VAGAFTGSPDNFIRRFVSPVGFHSCHGGCTMSDRPYRVVEPARHPGGYATLTRPDISLVAAGSLLVRTAVELAERHPLSEGINGEPWCLHCWSLWPCPPAQHAREVCNAAGVELPGLPEQPATTRPPAVGPGQDGYDAFDAGYDGYAAYDSAADERPYDGAGYGFDDESLPGYARREGRRAA
jgi:hypothetical protein